MLENAEKLTNCELPKLRQPRAAECVEWGARGVVVRLSNC